MRKSLIIYIGLCLLALTGGLLYYLYDPAEQILFPKCPFLLITGWQCPGCGSQRAIHHLLHLELLEAMKMNILVVLALPYLLFALYCDVKRVNSLKIERLYRLLYGSKASLFIALLFILFLVFRNM